MGAAQDRGRTPRRANRRALRAVRDQQGGAAQGLDDPPHGPAGRPRRRADARARRADARPPRHAPERRCAVGLRGQVGRRARARLLGARTPALRCSQRGRDHRALPGARAARPRAGLAPRGPRRRDRQLRRLRAPELRGAPIAYSRWLGRRRPAPLGRRSGHLRDLRSALAGRALVDRPRLRRASRDARRAEARPAVAPTSSRRVAPAVSRGSSPSGATAATGPASATAAGSRSRISPVRSSSSAAGLRAAAAATGGSAPSSSASTTSPAPSNTPAASAAASPSRTSTSCRSS